MATILIIEDDPLFRETLEDLINSMEHKAVPAATLEQGLQLAAQNECDLVLLDLLMPDGNGLDRLQELLQTPSRPEVSIITGLAKDEAARLAFSNGAWDYITKASSLDEIKLSVRRALEHRSEKQRHADENSPAPLHWEGVTGVSPASRNMMERIALAAQSDVNVLVTGQTGTGKELAARAIHANSSRAKGPFVIVDCASLPESLVENELFGHEKGAFTGANARQEGQFSLAHGGTLFLDEVGELPLHLQPALLRVLQERRFRPVGGQDYRESDFRLVAATNRDLEAMAEKGGFRSDLLYRIQALEVELPPLSERMEDVSLLCAHFLDSFCSRNKRPPLGMAPEVLEALFAHPWPGNVRELANTMERAAAAAGNVSTLHLAHLPPEIRMARLSTAWDPSQQGPAAAVLPDDTEGPFPCWNEYKAQMEASAAKAYFTRLLQRCDGDKKLAQQHSGLSRSQLYKLLREYGL